MKIVKSKDWLNHEKKLQNKLNIVEKRKKDKMRDKKSPTIAVAGGFNYNKKIITKKIQNINKKRKKILSNK